MVWDLDAYYFRNYCLSNITFSKIQMQQTKKSKVKKSKPKKLYLANEKSLFCLVLISLSLEIPFANFKKRNILEKSGIKKSLLWQLITMLLRVVRKNMAMRSTIIG